MFRFEHAEHLYALGIIPILIIFFLMAWVARKRLLERFADSSLLGALAPEISKYKHIVKFLLLAVALCFLVIGWANPQWGSKKEKVKRKSADVFIALDISRSMLAEDVRPSRIERARKFATRLVDELKGERIGTIIFAGNAYLQMPLTTDYAAAKLFIRSANPDQAPAQGTAIADAIELAERAFQDDNKHHKAIIIITDGENHDEVALTKAREANDNGMLIFTVGVGTPEGGYIPMNVNGRRSFKKDRSGNIVTTKLNQQMLHDLAQAGDGQYFNLVDGDLVLKTLNNRIDKIEKTEMEQRSFSEFESYFQYFIGFALFLILIEFFISYQRSRLLEGKDLFR